MKKESAENTEKSQFRKICGAVKFHFFAILQIWVQRAISPGNGVLLNWESVRFSLWNNVTLRDFVPMFLEKKIISGKGRRRSAWYLFRPRLWNHELHIFVALDSFAFGYWKAKDEVTVCRAMHWDRRRVRKVGAEYVTPGYVGTQIVGLFLGSKVVCLDRYGSKVRGLYLFTTTSENILGVDDNIWTRKQNRMHPKSNKRESLLSKALAFELTVQKGALRSYGLRPSPILGLEFSTNVTKYEP